MIYDPACYFGHSEAEFGMSWCSGERGAVFNSTCEELKLMLLSPQVSHLTFGKATKSLSHEHPGGRPGTGYTLSTISSITITFL